MTNLGIHLCVFPALAVCDTSWNIEEDAGGSLSQVLSCGDRDWRLSRLQSVPLKDEVVEAPVHLRISRIFPPSSAFVWLARNMTILFKN